jgi:hypothetical protein
MGADRQISLSLSPGPWPGSRLPPVREAERRNGAGITGAPCEGAPPALAGRRAFRRSTAAIFYDTTVQGLTGSERANPFRAPGRVATALRPIAPATEGGPLIGDGRWHRTLGRGYGPRLQAPLPAPSAERLRKTPSVSGNEIEHNRNTHRRQAHPCRRNPIGTSARLRPHERHPH